MACACFGQTIAFAGDFPFFPGVNHQDFQGLQEIEPLDDQVAERRTILADASGEHQRIRAAEDPQHRADPAAQAVRINIEREPGSLVAAFDRREDLPHVAGHAGHAEQSRFPVQNLIQLRPPCSRAVLSKYTRTPGSIEPLRVPIIRPSSGVKPMVVSTLFPSRTAASEAPLPRWQMIRRCDFDAEHLCGAARARIGG